MSRFGTLLRNYYQESTFLLLGGLFGNQTSFVNQCHLPALLKKSNPFPDTLEFFTGVSPHTGSCISARVPKMELRTCAGAPKWSCVRARGTCGSMYGAFPSSERSEKLRIRWGRLKHAFRVGKYVWRQNVSNPEQKFLCRPCGVHFKYH